MKFQEFRLLPRVIVVIFLVVFSFIFPRYSYAKSGCCSGHGGVNCSAGAQANGNVICNDGWRGSSCSYAEMVMCGGTTTRTTVVATVKPVVYTPVPTAKTVVYTPTPTLKETIKPSTVPTNTPTPVTNETTPRPSPEILGVIENSSLPSSSIPAQNSKGDTLGALIFLVILIGIPVLVIRKIVKHFNKAKSKE